MRHFPTQTMRQMHFALKKESSISFSVQFSLPWPTTIFAFLLMNAIEHKTPKVIQRGLSHAMITGPRTLNLSRQPQAVWREILGTVPLGQFLTREQNHQE